MQSDLFSARVYVFPISRSVEVGRMVRFLTVVHGERADAFYRKTCRRLAMQLRRSGVAEATIAAELAAFHHSVQHGIASGAARSAEGGSV